MSNENDWPQRFLSRIDLTLHEARVLEAISQHPDINRTDLLDYLAISESTLYRTLNGCKNRGIDIKDIPHIKARYDIFQIVNESPQPKKMVIVGLFGSLCDLVGIDVNWLCDWCGSWLSCDICLPRNGLIKRVEIDLAKLILDENFLNQLLVLQLRVAGNIDQRLTDCIKSLEIGQSSWFKELTPSEKRIVKQIEQDGEIDMTHKNLARKLNMSVHTLNKHLQHIYKKLRVDTYIGLINLIFNSK